MQCKPILLYEFSKIKNGPYTILLAKTPCQKQQGLQNVKKLPYDTVMLFLDVPHDSYFHTNNCLFPMDIISLDSNNRVLKIITAVPNQESIGPTPMGTNKVLEAAARWCSNRNIKVGDYLPFLIF